MKKLYLFLILSTIVFSCKKEEKKPVSNPPINTTALYIYRVYGIQASDTAQVTINGQASESTYGYNKELKSGDIVSFYFSSANPAMNFSIWKNANELPNPTYYNAVERVANSNYFLRGIYTVKID